STVESTCKRAKLRTNPSSAVSGSHSDAESSVTSASAQSLHDPSSRHSFTPLKQLMSSASRCLMVIPHSRCSPGSHLDNSRGTNAPELESKSVGNARGASEHALFNIPASNIKTIQRALSGFPIEPPNRNDVNFMATRFIDVAPILRTPEGVSITTTAIHYHGL